MKTSFEFEYQGHKVKACNVQFARSGSMKIKLFDFRIEYPTGWRYQGTLSFSMLATKKDITQAFAKYIGLWREEIFSLIETEIENQTVDGSGEQK